MNEPLGMGGQVEQGILNYEVYSLLQKSEFVIQYSIFNASAFPDTDHGHRHVHPYACLFMHS